MNKWAVFSLLLISAAFLFGCCCAGGTMGCAQSCFAQVQPCAEECQQRCGDDQSCLDTCGEKCGTAFEACMEYC